MDVVRSGHLDITVLSVITEITDMAALSLTKRRFILHWGEMGGPCKGKSHGAEDVAWKAAK
jgi:hypothetical protein